MGNWQKEGGGVEEPPCREVESRYAQVSPLQKSEALEGELQCCHSDLSHGPAQG